MSVITRCWRSMKGDPGFMRRLNGWLTIFWILMLPVSLMMGWFDKVVYISALSLWALVSGHWSAWQAARVECEQQREYQEMVEDPLEARVVRAVVRETTLEPADRVNVRR